MPEHLPIHLPLTIYYSPCLPADLRPLTSDLRPLKIMNMKKYRATTMREALEQVRQELGDDALVLDTKKVRAGGLLGLGGREMVEVRVTADDAPESEPQFRRRSVKPASENKGNSLLNLHDDSLALPSSDAKASSHLNASTYPALTARAVGFAEAKRNSDVTSRSEQTENPLPRQTVELAETAPKIVHRPTSSAVQNASPTDVEFPSQKPAATHAATETATSAATRTTAPASDIERLHAELREMKFTLGRLTARSLAGDSFLASHALLPASDSSEADAELYDSPYYEAYIELTATGLSPESARRFVRNTMRTSAVAADTDPSEFARRVLLQAIEESVQFADESFVLPQSGGLQTQPIPFNSPLVFIGPTGVGKTTTIAKLAAHIALRQRRRVELITLDTYRIAAVEQLKTYAEIIGAGCHVASSVLELNALANRFSGESVVLVDTTGRSPHDLADQLELADYLRASDDFLKCLVLPATSHPADAQIAVRKFALYGANRLAFTKIDETSRPGAIVEVASEARLPLLYLCSGQRVPEDLEHASAANLAAQIIRHA